MPVMKPSNLYVKIAVTGTAVQFTSAVTKCRKMIVRARSGNAAGPRVYIGGSGVTSTAASFELAPGESVTIDPDGESVIQLDMWYVNGTANDVVDVMPIGVV